MLVDRRLSYELQTLFVAAVRIVNDRPLTTVSDDTNDLLPITPSCFSGQHLFTNTPLGEVHDKRAFERTFYIIPLWLIGSGTA